MMIMRPPQHGQGRESVGGSAASADSVPAGDRVRHRNIEQRPCSGDVIGAGAVGEEPVVANAMEAGGQDVDEEAADEPAQPVSMGLYREDLQSGSPCI